LPFVAKATGVPLAKLANAGSGLGEKLADLDIRPKGADLYFIKAFRSSPGSKFAWPRHVVPRPEMRSTGEVMGGRQVRYRRGVREGAARRQGCGLPTSGGRVPVESAYKRTTAASVGIAGSLAHRRVKR
jgi:hypothetical protein